MYQYILNKNPQPMLKGEHEVHLVGCSHGPEVQNRINLGYYPSCASAVTAARSAYTSWHIDGCAYCVPTCHRR